MTDKEKAIQPKAPETQGVAASERILPIQQDGILVINKPKGPSSAACIAKIKRQLGQKKIGHAGTLDPMASGVLIVLLGQGTKLSGHLLEGGSKAYSATVKLGESTDTWDAEGEIVETFPLPDLSFEQLKAEVESWVGSLEQEVPPYSAAKHQGQPLYKLARKGFETPVKIKTVEISRAELEWFEPPFLRFRVACSSGTYIRSLAHSLGIRLGCGGMLTELTRDYSHPFGLEQAFNLDSVLAEPEKLSEKVLSVSRALPEWPTVFVENAEAALIKNGHRIACKPMQNVDGKLPRAGTKAILLDTSGKVLALAEASPEQGGKASHKSTAEDSEVKGQKMFWAIVRGLWNQ